MTDPITGIITDSLQDALDRAIRVSIIQTGERNKERVMKSWVVVLKKTLKGMEDAK